jgi:ATP-binding cassette subfamily B protein
MTAPGPLSSATGDPAAPARAGRGTARRVVPLFRPCRVQVAAVVGLIVVTSTLGIISPLLIRAVFSKALFVAGGPGIRLLVILVAVMAVVAIVDGAIGILQACQATRVGQRVMRDLRDRLCAPRQALPLAFFAGTKTGEIRSRLASDGGGVRSVVTTTASTMLASVVIFVSTVAAVVILSWQLTIVAVSTVPVFFWLAKTAGGRRRRVARWTRQSLAAMSALSGETLPVSRGAAGDGVRQPAARHRPLPPGESAPGRPGSPPADDRPGLLRDRAVVFCRSPRPRCP